MIDISTPGPAADCGCRRVKSLRRCIPSISSNTRATIRARTEPRQIRTWLLLTTLSVLITAFAGIGTSYAQEPGGDTTLIRSTIDVRVGNPRATGFSMGPIATVNVENKGNQHVDLKPQLFYVPPTKTASGYVGRVPAGLRIDSGSSRAVELIGYRMRASLPPVEAGQALPPANRWPVSEIIETTVVDTTPATSFTIISGPVVSRYHPDDIPHILRSSGFSPDSNARPIVALFPDTQQPIPGTMDPATAPIDFAPLLMSSLRRIESAAAELIKSNRIDTPYKDDYKREYQTIVLHAIWLTTAAMTGTEYSKEQFSQEIFDSLTEVDEDLSEADKSALQPGIDSLWDAIVKVAEYAGMVHVQSRIAK